MMGSDTSGIPCTCPGTSTNGQVLIAYAKDTGIHSRYMLAELAYADARTPAWLDPACWLLQKQLGGGEGIEGIYGSITQKGTQRIFSSLHHNCGMGHDSVLVDVGAGLGRPLVHALFCPGVRVSCACIVLLRHQSEMVHALVHKESWLSRGPHAYVSAMCILPSIPSVQLS